MCMQSFFYLMYLKSIPSKMYLSLSKERALATLHILVHRGTGRNADMEYVKRTGTAERFGIMERCLNSTNRQKRHMIA
jgi:hypothetical protein